MQWSNLPGGYVQSLEGNLAIWLEIPGAEHAFDAVFNGVNHQLTLYYTERFLAWCLKSDKQL